MIDKISIAFLLIFAIFMGFLTSAYPLTPYELSNEICKDLKTDEEKIVALREAVYNKMKPNGNGFTLKDCNNMSYEQMWNNGVGWCNHQCNVFMLLAREQGISTRLLYLLTKDMKESQHTIAEAKLGNKWVVVDVGNNIDFRYNGELATKNDMVADFDNVVWEKVKDLGQDKEYWRMFIYPSYLIKTLDP